MIREGFVLRKMQGMNLVMPTGENVKEYNGAVMLNDTAAFIYEKLSEGKSKETVANELGIVYNIEADRARQAVENTVKQLDEAGVISHE